MPDAPLMMLSAYSIGTPVAISVPSVRQKRETADFRVMSPTTGMCSFILSIRADQMIGRFDKCQIIVLILVIFGCFTMILITFFRCES